MLILLDLSGAKFAETNSVLHKEPLILFEGSDKIPHDHGELKTNRTFFFFPNGFLSWSELEVGDFFF